MGQSKSINKLKNNIYQNICLDTTTIIVDIFFKNAEALLKKLLWVLCTVLTQWSGSDLLDSHQKRKTDYFPKCHLFKYNLPPICKSVIQLWNFRTRRVSKSSLGKPKYQLWEVSIRKQRQSQTIKEITHV